MFPWKFGAGTRCSKAILQTLFKDAINDCSLPPDHTTGQQPATAFAIYRNLVQFHLAHGKYVHSVLVLIKCKVLSALYLSSIATKSGLPHPAHLML